MKDDPDPRPIKKKALQRLKAKGPVLLRRTKGVRFTTLPKRMNPRRT